MGQPQNGEDLIAKERKLGIWLMTHQWSDWVVCQRRKTCAKWIN